MLRWFRRSTYESGAIFPDARGLIFIFVTTDKFILAVPVVIQNNH